MIEGKAKTRFQLAFLKCPPGDLTDPAFVKKCCTDAYIATAQSREIIATLNRNSIGSATTTFIGQEKDCHVESKAWSAQNNFSFSAQVTQKPNISKPAQTRPSD